jgi:hypothetical protein
MVDSLRTVLESGPSATITVAEHLVGTPGLHVSGADHAVGARCAFRYLQVSDCVLYEIVAGRRAFTGATPFVTVRATVVSEPAPVSSAERAVPPVKRIVHRCLKKNPSLRFQSVADLAFALQTVTVTYRVTCVRSPRPRPLFVLRLSYRCLPFPSSSPGPLLSPRSVPAAFCSRDIHAAEIPPRLHFDLSVHVRAECRNTVDAQTAYKKRCRPDAVFREVNSDRGTLPGDPFNVFGTGPSSKHCSSSSISGSAEWVPSIRFDRDVGYRRREML